MTRTKGYDQLQAIITEILQSEDWPHWTFINNVLSAKQFSDESELWFHWGELRIVTKEQRRADVTLAKDCPILADWNTETDGTITLIGEKQEVTA